MIKATVGGCLFSEENLRNAFADLKHSYELEPNDTTLNALVLIGEDLRKFYGVDFRPYKPENV